MLLLTLAGGEVYVEGPKVATPPRAVLNAPLTIGPCDRLSLKVRACYYFCTRITACCP